MTKDEFIDVLEQSPIIAAIKQASEIEKALTSDCRTVFILYGNLLEISDIVARFKQQNKVVFVHMDLIEGLSAQDVAVDYIAKNTGADGIISTKSAVISCARSREILTVQRFFVLDSMSLSNIERQVYQTKPDFAEILPGVMPKIVRMLSGSLRRPLIASGLIRDKDDVMTALSAGAIAVSSTNDAVWSL
ncbi:MAG: glycerol-3-phosphate responsive antiterminator [Oscillospiraceae bacterium]